jgi:hypothetical protein
MNPSVLEIKIRKLWGPPGIVKRGVAQTENWIKKLRLILKSKLPNYFLFGFIFNKFAINTGHTQKNGAVSKVNKKLTISFI